MTCKNPVIFYKFIARSYITYRRWVSVISIDENKIKSLVLKKFKNTIRHASKRDDLVTEMGSVCEKLGKNIKWFCDSFHFIILISFPMINTNQFLGIFRNNLCWTAPILRTDFHAGQISTIKFTQNLVKNICVKWWH